MTKAALIFRNLWYFRKPYLAIMAGMVISISVLTGALIIGDSVRLSLEKLTEVRLGHIRYALESGDRTFRDTLATEMAGKLNATVVPALESDGIAINNNNSSRINNCKIIGINADFSKLWTEAIDCPIEDEAVLSSNTAQKLGLKAGDDILLKVRIPDKAPQNAPFVSAKSTTISLQLKIKSIASDNSFGRFSLKSNQSAPFNVFVNLNQLSSKLKLNGKANLLLIGSINEHDIAPGTPDSLLKLCWKPADAGILLNSKNNSSTFQISPERIFLDSTLSAAAIATINHPAPVLTYLANAVSTKTHTTPYSFITAADSNYLNISLKENEIIFNDWLADDLEAKPGDSVKLTYFTMGPLRKLKEESAVFLLKSIISIKDSIWDADLMPQFPGISEAGNCRDWETGAPIDLKKIRDKDEKYWKDFHGTPKAFISLKTGQKIWKNPFGILTGIRFSSKISEIPLLEKSWMQKLDPRNSGLRFRAVYEEGISAARNSTDFGQLFLSLSFFIIVSGLILIGMLFSLHASSRLKEAGILSAIGIRKSVIIKILFSEALIVSFISGIIGAFAGIAYNKLLLACLNTLWQDAVRTSSLETFVCSGTLITGSLAGIFLSLTVVLFILLSKLKKPQTSLLKGITEIPDVKKIRQRLYPVLTIAILGAALILILSLVLSASTKNPVFFMLGGGLLLAGFLLTAKSILGSQQIRSSKAFPGFIPLVLKNISRNPSRTLGIITLLSLGTFSIIITGANQRSFYGEENDPASGTGGFLFWGETVIPLVYDLNTSIGKSQYGLNDEEVLKDVHLVQMPGLTGNDASCLNLNQVNQPAMLGVNEELFDKSGLFSFTNGDGIADKSHPWLALQKVLTEDVIPGFADQSVITWGLRKSVGDTLIYRDESGKILKIKLLAGLDNSIFQGNIIISDSLFRKFYPSQSSSRVFLVKGPFAMRKEIAERLEYLFQDQGIVLTSASTRLAEFNSVQNTYLSVFMMLGGLGLILGTAGLAFFIVRNIQERRTELAIYLSIGFTKKFIRKLLITEYLLLLTSAMVFGVTAALAAIIPSFISSAFELPTSLIIIIVAIVFLSGLISIMIPVLLHKSYQLKTTTD